MVLRRTRARGVSKPTVPHAGASAEDTRVLSCGCACRSALEVGSSPMPSKLGGCAEWFEDSRRRASRECRGCLGVRPHHVGQELEKRLGLVPGFEIQVNDQVAGVIDRTTNPLANHATLCPGVCEAVKCRFPGAEIG